MQQVRQDFLDVPFARARPRIGRIGADAGEGLAQFGIGLLVNLADRLGQLGRGRRDFGQRTLGQFQRLLALFRAAIQRYRYFVAGAVRAEGRDQAWSG